MKNAAQKAARHTPLSGVARRWLLVAMVAMMAAATGCSSPPSTSSASDPSLQGRWQLQKGSDEQGVFDLSESWITLEIARTTNGIGLTPCNNYGVTIIGGAGAVLVTQTFSTRADCFDDDLNRLEGRYLDALVSATHAGLRNGYLVFSAADAALTFRPASQLNTPEMVGTLWSLESLVRWVGEEPTLVPAAGEGALWVELNGGFRGGTGCRSFDGRYEVRDGEMDVTRITTTPGACAPGFDSQETHVSLVLGEGLRAEVVGDLLTLHNDVYGLGLVYRAIR